jgi:tetratricopeptide (TPR) repeat protein
VLRPVIERFLPSRHGASGLNTTAADLAAWVIALEQGALLRPDTREALWTPATFSDGTAGQWAMGWQVLQRGSLRVVGMTGGGRAAFSIYPEQRLAVILLTNLAGAYPEDLVDTIASLYAPDLTLTGVPALRTHLEATGFADVSAAATAVERVSPGMTWPESELNDWGYRLLSAGRTKEALAVFAFIVERFPRSGNAHDSLAEAFATIGDTPAAVRHYRRSLELDPQNTHARRQLERLAPANQPRP